MISRVSILAIAFLVAAATFNAQDDKKTDKDKVQGDWVVVSMEISGKKMDADAIKNSKLVVKGDAWTPTTNGRELKLTFTLDASKTPKQIDVTAKSTGQELTWAGIYTLAGDTLTVCRPVDSSGERPKEMKAGEGVVFAVYKRAEKK